MANHRKDHCLSNIVGMLMLATLLLLPVVEAFGEPADQITNALGMRFVCIRGGTFQMGSPLTEPQRNRDEKPRVVVIDKDYYIGATEVTQGQWRRLMKNNPSRFSNLSKRHPVERVSWIDVQQFIQRLNQTDRNHRYRLPSEAEWEYACRAGTRGAYSTGPCLTSAQANFDGSRPLPGCAKGKFKGRTTAVASYAPNAWGLSDMHGNVWEWCQDWYHATPTDGPVNPVSRKKARYRVIRGGGWFYLDHDARSANRDRSAPDLRLEHVGFRLVLEPTTNPKN